jgi:hypothetical protein
MSVILAVKQEKRRLHTQRAAPTERKQKSFQPRGLQCNKLTTYSKYCSSHDRQACPRSIRVFPVLELYLVSILAAHAVGPITERYEKTGKRSKQNKKNSRNSGRVHMRRSRHACSTNSTRQYLSLFRTSIAEPADFAPRSEVVLEVCGPIPIRTARRNEGETREKEGTHLHLLFGFRKHGCWITKYFWGYE